MTRSRTAGAEGPRRTVKPRVHKDRRTGPAFPAGRNWACTPDGIETRTTYWPTMEEAVAWATMDPAVKAAQIAYDEQFEMGQ